MRFGGKKNGYHGGASPQEVVIPLGVFAAVGRLAWTAGWRSRPRCPPWWEPRQAAAVPPRAGQAGEAEGDRRRPRQHDDLFATGRSQRLRGTRVDRPALGQRGDAGPAAARARGSRCPRSASARSWSRSTSAAASSPGRRWPSASTCRRCGSPGCSRRCAGVLNVDGYAVLSVDEASDTVELNKAQLLAQFGL